MVVVRREGAAVIGMCGGARCRWGQAMLGGGTAPRGGRRRRRRQGRREGIGRMRNKQVMVATGRQAYCAKVGARWQKVGCAEPPAATCPVPSRSREEGSGCYNNHCSGTK